VSSKITHLSFSKRKQSKSVEKLPLSHEAVSEFHPTADDAWSHKNAQHQQQRAETTQAGGGETKQKSSRLWGCSYHPCCCRGGGGCEINFPLSRSMRSPRSGAVTADNNVGASERASPSLWAPSASLIVSCMQLLCVVPCYRTVCSKHKSAQKESLGAALRFFSLLTDLFEKHFGVRGDHRNYTLPPPCPGFASGREWIWERAREE
jgi:hypothetical protein